MRSTLTLAVLQVLSCAGIAASLPAQQAATLDSVLRRELARSSLVRMRDEGARTSGKLVGISAGVATLETAAGSRSVPLAGVDSVWARRRATGVGALVGGGVGAIVVGIFGATTFTSAVVCDGTASCATGDRVKLGLMGGVVGALAGGLVGAGIGALIPRWHRIYPAR